MFRAAPPKRRSGAGFIIGGIAILGVVTVLALPHVNGFKLNFKPPAPVKTEPSKRDPNTILISALFTGSPRTERDAVVVYLTINNAPTKKLTIYRSPWSYPLRVPITPTTLILVTVRQYDPKGKADCALTKADGNSPFGGLDYDTRTGGREAASCAYPVPLGTPLGH